MIIITKNKFHLLATEKKLEEPLAELTLYNHMQHQVSSSCDAPKQGIKDI